MANRREMVGDFNAKREKKNETLNLLPKLPLQAVAPGYCLGRQRAMDGDQLINWQVVVLNFLAQNITHKTFVATFIDLKMSKQLWFSSESFGPNGSSVKNHRLEHKGQHPFSLDSLALLLVIKSQVKTLPLPFSV